MHLVNQESKWFLACRVEDVPENGGACVQYGQHQIALFFFARRGEWYACDNQCPHKKQMAISRGMLGSHQGVPKVACPFHKKTFSLLDGHCLNSDEGYALKTFNVKLENGLIYIDVSALDNHQSTENKIVAYEKHPD